MLGTLNIANAKGRDATVNFVSEPIATTYQYVAPDGNPVSSKKYIKFPREASYEALTEEYGDIETFTDALIEEDIELDMEVTGRYLENTSRVYINTSGQVVFSIAKTEKIFDAAGELKSSREPKEVFANVRGENPVKWSGKTFPKKKIYNKFAFLRRYQLVHDSGLKYDFLYDMAKQLHEKEEMIMIGAGKGTDPIVLRDGGKPYRAFLEGRVKGDKYILLIHLTNMELKPIPPTAE